MQRHAALHGRKIDQRRGRGIDDIPLGSDHLGTRREGVRGDHLHCSPSHRMVCVNVYLPMMLRSTLYSSVPSLQDYLALVCCLSVHSSIVRSNSDHYASAISHAALLRRSTRPRLPAVMLPRMRHNSRRTFSPSHPRPPGGTTTPSPPSSCLPTRGFQRIRLTPIPSLEHT